jgi:hypothetical protein
MFTIDSAYGADKRENSCQIEILLTRMNFSHPYAVTGIQATRHLVKIHCVSSCRSSRARSSGLCNRT